MQLHLEVPVREGAFSRHYRISPATGPDEQPAGPREVPTHLLDAVGPALPDPVPGPHVMGVFCQLVHQRLLGLRESDKSQVHRGRFVSTRQLVATEQREDVTGLP